MKKVYSFLASIVALASVSACNLDYNPTNAQIYTNYDELFYTYEDATMYASVINSYYRATQQGSYWQTNDAQCDMFNSTISSGNTYGTVHTMGSGFTTADSYIETVWTGNMYAIFQANCFIANIGNVNTENLSATELKTFNAYCGRAYLLRALSLFTTSLYFAPAYNQCDPATTLAMPIVTEPNVIGRPSRSTLEACFAQVESDLAIAKAYLVEDVPTTTGTFYASYDAVVALEARFYLAKGEYTKAATAADYLINCGTYELANTIAELTDECVDQKSTIESIFLGYASISESTNSNSMYVGSASNVSNSFAYSPTFLPTKTLVNMYSSVDIRGYVYIGQLNFYYVGEAIETTFLTRYKGNPALTSNSYHTGLTMPRVFGLPEQYLIAAEAMAMMGNEGSAKEYLNELQKARGATLTDGTMENIKTEWARETVGEGFRLHCLKRWGDGFSGRTPLVESFVSTGIYYDELTVAADYYKLTWPVPNSEMQSNTSLVQNPGWSSSN